MSLLLVRPEELESPTFGSVDQRSIQLRYGRICINEFSALIGTKVAYESPHKMSLNFWCKPLNSQLV